MKSHCQPFSPKSPLNSSSAPDTGPPTMVASGIAAMNKRHDARPLPRRKPIGEVKDDAGEEARLGHPQQKTHDIEAGLAAHERHGGGDQPPADHDAGDPDAGAEALEREIARDLEQDVADEKNAGAGAVDRRREAEIRIHGKRGVADIHPVEEIHRVAETEKGNEPARGLGDRRLSRLVGIHLAPPSPDPSCPALIRDDLSAPRTGQWHG